MKKIITILALFFTVNISFSQCTLKVNPDSVAMNGEVLDIVGHYLDTNGYIFISALVSYKNEYYSMDAYWINVDAEDEPYKIIYKENIRQENKRRIENILHDENN